MENSWTFHGTKNQETKQKAERKRYIKAKMKSINEIEDREIIDLFILGAKNPNSIQLCHEEPLSEEKIMHNEDNCFWGHRQCNSMQGDHSIASMMIRMEKIVQYQNKKRENSLIQY